MSRSGYSDDCDNDEGQYAMWRGQVASAIRGKRGQAFLREMIETLDAMPEKRLIAKSLRKDGEVCALGCVGAKRGIEMDDLDPENPQQLAAAFGIAHQLVSEIEYWNDEVHAGRDTPETRWTKMREWVAKQIKVTT